MSDKRALQPRAVVSPADAALIAALRDQARRFAHGPRVELVAADRLETVLSELRDALSLITLLEKLLITWDADQDDEFNDVMAEVRTALGFELAAPEPGE